MNQQADSHLSRLIDKAETFEEALRKAGRAKSHRLGHGIDPKRSYTTARWKLSLPGSDVAVASIGPVLETSVLGLNPELSSAAWGALLDRPSLILPLNATPGLQLPPSASSTSLRHLALATVLRPSMEWSRSGLLTAERVAGVAELSVLPAPDGRGAGGAWLQGRWTHSARELVTWLEAMLGASSVDVKPSGKRIAVVISEDSLDSGGESLIASLRITAATVGLSLEGHKYTGQSHENIKNSLNLQRPNHLIAVGAEAGLVNLVDGFTTVNGPGSAELIRPTENGSVRETLRERFLSTARISNSLQRVEPPAELIIMPIVQGGCLHDAAFVYVEDVTTGLWWSRDLDEHGGSFFKTYTRDGMNLNFNDDRDIAGRTIDDKHKGPKRVKIALSTLNPCNRSGARSHVEFSSVSA